MTPSTNEYDWLGHGVYFWDNSPSRALEFATFLEKNPNKARRPIKKPAVIGAVLELGHCLDLLDYENLQFVKDAYNALASSYNASGISLPQNKTVGTTKDLLLRELDCAVIRTLHAAGKKLGRPSFDSVRGVFWEGDELYENAGFREKDHIQICICNPNCIKGYFLPKSEEVVYSRV